MIKPSFDIVSEHWSADGSTRPSLLMEVGKAAFSMVLFDDETRKLLALRHYVTDSIPGRTHTETLFEIIQNDQLLNMPLQEAIVVYNYPESSLIPSEYFDITINKSLISLVYGDANKGLVLSERISGQDMYNIYRIPRDIHSFIQSHFAAGKYWHLYSLLLSSFPTDEKSRSKLQLIFYSDHLIVTAIKEGSLQLLNTYYYHTPEDVAFYILSVCQQLNLDPDSVLIEMEGLVDEHSALHSELVKYFREVHAKPSNSLLETDKMLEEYPPHYFSPLLKLASCVL